MGVWGVVAARTDFSSDTSASSLNVARRRQRGQTLCRVVHSGVVTARLDVYAATLERAAHHARSWLASMPDRPVPPQLPVEAIRDRLAGPLPEGPTDPATVVDLLAEVAEPGLMAMPSGRFFGWVIGGTVPAALGADWLTSAWDQNSGMRFATPGTVAVEECAGDWLLDLLGLPPDADVGFVTGGTMANFTGLAAGRQQVLTDAGWDLDADGLTGAPRVRVLVGAERHGTVDLALRYLGLGAPPVVASDEQGRIRVDALSDALEDCQGPIIVVLQAGTCTPVPSTRSALRRPSPTSTAPGCMSTEPSSVGGGFTEPASPPERVRGCRLLGDRRAQDAERSLRLRRLIVARPRAVRDAMGMQASYLVHAEGPGDPLDKVPELSRRARGVPVWAALHSLGRSGVAELVDGLTQRATAIADGIRSVEGADVLNDVVYTQVCASFGDDQRTKEVTERLLADGTAWMSGSRWRERNVLRVSVSNWSTDDDDVHASLEALRRAASSTRPG
jgi:glutamate/tyrosine decarboxylase-like PLP-dependent enzyme